MRRLAFFGALGVLSVLGFGSAYVLAQPTSGTQNDQITICHSGSAKNFTAISPANAGVLEGHAKNDESDIIPPFFVVTDGTTTSFPGRNLGTTFDGFLGSEILYNNPPCEIPAGGRVASTVTVTTGTTLTQTVTAAATTATAPPTTVTITVPTTVSLPSQTVTARGASTTVRVSTGQTTTVTVPSKTATLRAATVTAPVQTVTHPAQTVTVAGKVTTLPAKTVTVGGGVVTEPVQTVTVPGTTTTVTAAGTTTVVTVTAPGTRLVRGGVLAARFVRAVELRRRLVHLRARVLRFVIKRLSQQTRVTVIVIRYRGCPAGTALHNGDCSPIVRGKG